LLTNLKLTRLDLGGTRVNDNDLKAIATITTLEKLRIGEETSTGYSGIFYRDIGLEYISSLPKLRKLRFVVGEYITYNGVSILANLPELTSLTVNSSNRLLDGRHLAIFLGFPHLKQLNMEFCEDEDETIDIMLTNTKIKVEYSKPIHSPGHGDLCS
jgi:hypothetical protein